MRRRIVRGGVGNERVLLHHLHKPTCELDVDGIDARRVDFYEDIFWILDLGDWEF